MTFHFSAILWTIAAVTNFLPTVLNLIKGDFHKATLHGLITAMSIGLVMSYSLKVPE